MQRLCLLPITYDLLPAVSSSPPLTWSIPPTTGQERNLGLPISEDAELRELFRSEVLERAGVLVEGARAFAAGEAAELFNLCSHEDSRSLRYPLELACTEGD